MGWIAAAFTALLVPLGCGGSAADAPAKPPMGQMPSASTSAAGEWLPWRVTAGTSVPSDDREERLFEVRRVTEGWIVQQIAWTPDGTNMLVAAVRPGERGLSLNMIPSSAGPATRLSRIGDEVRAFAVGGTKSAPRIVYSTPKGRGLFEVDAEGVVRQVEIGALSVDAATMGPDSKVFVVAKESSAPHIFSVELGDKAPKPILSTDVATIAPAISPDRSYVAYGRRETSGGARVLAYASIEGRSGGELATVDHALRHLSFHPSGRWLAFSSDRDTLAFDIYAVELPGTLSVMGGSGARGELHRLTFSQADAPSFSPDGRSLAFSSTRQGATSDLYVARFLEDP